MEDSRLAFKAEYIGPLETKFADSTNLTIHSAPRQDVHAKASEAVHGFGARSVHARDDVHAPPTPRDPRRDILVRHQARGDWRQGVVSYPPRRLQVARVGGSRKQAAPPPSTHGGVLEHRGGCGVFLPRRNTTETRGGGTRVGKIRQGETIHKDRRAVAHGHRAARGTAVLSVLTRARHGGFGRQDAQVQAHVHSAPEEMGGRRPRLRRIMAHAERPMADPRTRGNRVRRRQGVHHLRRRQGRVRIPRRRRGTRAKVPRRSLDRQIPRQSHVDVDGSRSDLRFLPIRDGGRQGRVLRSLRAARRRVRRDMGPASPTPGLETTRAVLVPRALDGRDARGTLYEQPPHP